MNILIAVPAHNEEAIIEQSLRRLFDTLPRLLAAHEWSVVIAENASSDHTAAIGDSLRQEFPNLSVLCLPRPGKGNAIKAAWKTAEADAYVFMDADLSAELNHLPKLLDALLDADLAVGSRHLPGSSVRRGTARTILSHLYNAAARSMLALPTRDFQCGFKAIRSAALRAILPCLEHDGYFFDTELLAFAHQTGCRVAEVPIAWAEHPSRERKSKVNIPKTSLELMQNLWRLKKRLRNRMV